MVGLLLACVITVGPARADEPQGREDGGAGPNGPAEHFYNFGLSSSFVDAAGIGSNGGEASFTSLGASVKVWKFTLRYDQDHYSWDRKGQLPFGNGTDDPWTDLKTVGLAFHHGDRLSGKWGYFLMGGVASSYESEMGSPQGMVMAAAQYMYSRKTSFRFGLAGMASELDVTVLPVLGFNYNGVGRGGAGWSAGLGVPETEVAYHFDDVFAVRLNAEMDHGTYKLADDSTVSPDGWLKKSGYGGGLYLDVTPIENVECSVGGFYLFEREWELFDKNKHSLGAYDVDNALGAKLELKILF